MKTSVPSLRIITAAALALLVPASASALGPHDRYRGPARSLVVPVAIFGADDRTELPKSLKSLGRSIGLLFNDTERTVCTAFCVAPDLIATASHCVVRNPPGKTPFQLTESWFAVDGEVRRVNTRIRGYDTGGAARSIAVGTTALRLHPPFDSAKDWALVRIAEPVCKGHELPLAVLSPDDLEQRSREGKVFHVAYHRDFEDWRLAHAAACEVARGFDDSDAASIERDFADPAAMIFHRCDTGGASSGSPLLLMTPEGPKVAGISVGTYVQSKMLVSEGKIEKAMKPETVANTAINAGEFAAQLTKLAATEPVDAPKVIAAMQRELARLGFYAGTVDGSFGDGTRAAITAYELSRNLAPIGLPTVALLRGLLPPAASP